MAIGQHQRVKCAGGQLARERGARREGRPEGGDAQWEGRPVGETPKGRGAQRLEGEALRGKGTQRGRLPEGGTRGERDVWREGCPGGRNVQRERCAGRKMRGKRDSRRETPADINERVRDRERMRRGAPVPGNVAPKTESFRRRDGMRGNTIRSRARVWYNSLALIRR